MKKNFFRFSRFLSLMIILFVISSCQQKEKGIDAEFSRYISAFTYGNIPSDAFVQIELTQDFPSVELNSAIKEKLFSFSPSVKGSAFWLNNHTVRFVPEPGELKPGTKYGVRFGLGKLLKVDKKFNSFDFNIHVNRQSFSVDIGTYSPQSINDLEWNGVAGSVSFSNPVSIEDVKRMISVKGSNQAVVNVVAVSSVQYKVSVDSLFRSDADNTYKISFDGKEIGSKSKYEHEVFIPALSKDFYVVNEVSIYDKAEQYICVSFSDPVSTSQDITGLFSLSNIKNYTYRIDKNILKIYPESFPSGSFNLNINKGLKNISGLYLGQNYNFQLQAQSSKPQIKIDDGGNILPNSEQLFLPFSAVNLWAVDVKIIKVYQNNILYYLQSKSFNNEYNSGEVRRFGRLIKKLQLRLDTDKSLDLTNWNNFSIDLAEMFSEDPGSLYVVQLSMKPEYSLYSCDGRSAVIPENISMRRFSDTKISEEDEALWDTTSPYYYESFDWSQYRWEDRDNPCTPSYYIGSEKISETLLLSSNVGIIAKSSLNNSMMVVVTDIMSAKPISESAVTIYNYQMQAIGSGKTDSNGFANIEYKGGAPYVVVAQHAKEFGYLEVAVESSLSLSSFDVSGKEIQKGLKGYTYTERGVWRPGDSIYVSFILEDKEKKLPKDHPVTLEVYTPKGQFYQKQVKTEGLNGFYTFIIDTDPNAETGVWQARIKVGGATFYKQLRIETIKPNRLKVRFDTDTIIDASRGIISGTLSSQWLHGSPASNLKAEIELSLYKSDNPFKGYVGYSFNNPLLSFERSKSEIFKGTLNSLGTVGVNAKIPVAENAPGMLRGNILSRVYEPGGDMSFYSQTLYYSPYNRYVGIKSPSTSSGDVLETDSPISFDITMLNLRGQPLSGDTSFKIYKLGWSWWWDSSNSDLATYVNSSSANVVSYGDTYVTNGKGKVNFQVDYPDWGRYLILVKDKSGGHTSGVVFYVDWPSWRGRSMKTDPNNPTMLSFTSDKSSYQVGEKAVISIPGSANGNVLITLENSNGIIKKEWVKSSNSDDIKYTIDITKEMTPNFYVFVTMLQPHNQTDNDLPIRMYGVKNVSVENKESKLTPIIKMPDVLSPEKEFTISVSEKDKKPMTYTIAIVDDGLLDLTSFKTPNAWDEFYSREALGVRSWDLFNRVIGANSGRFASILSIGGDEALKASGDKVNRFKSVVKFMGPFTIKSGEVKNHNVTLPQYVGSVRTMLIAGGDGAYGSSEKTTEVKSSLMTLSTLPRVLGPGEEVWLPVNVFALERDVSNVQISVKTNGILKPVGETTKRVTFTKPGDQVVYFKFKSENKIGSEQIQIISSANGVSFSENIDIEIRNPIPPVVVTDSKIIDSSSLGTLRLAADGVGAENWATLELSRLPSVSYSKNINFLTSYPHSCTEQIVSQGFPLLYAEVFESLDDDSKKDINNKISEIIRVISGRQLSDGGFSYWSGDNYATDWATTYAGHFLIEAKNKGYNVPESILSRWVQFQKKKAQSWTLTNPNQGYYSISMLDLQQSYRLYTLALSGNTELGAMNRLKEIDGLSIQSRWRLAAAYAIAGKADVANALVFNVDDVVEDYSFNNDSYGSAARDKAMIMETYLLLNNIERALSMAPAIAESLSDNYVTTQTAAYGLIVMAKLYQKMGEGVIDIDWKLNGKDMKSVNTPKAQYQIGIEPSQSLVVDINNKGKGKIYARVSMLTQPLVDKGNEAKSGLFDIGVRYISSDSRVLNVESLSQGQEFVAEVAVRNGAEQSFTDLALTHIFPSGWEILNERVLEGTQSVSRANFNYQDIRDDRVLTYFNLAAGESKTFRVRLQASYKGKFYLPAVSCQAMYAPNEQARNVGMWVEVVD